MGSQWRDWRDVEMCSNFLIRQIKRAAVFLTRCSRNMCICDRRLVKSCNSQGGEEDHTFGPTKVREHFPEEELTLGKNRLLEVARLVEWEWIELNGIKYSSLSSLETVCCDKSAWICLLIKHKFWEGLRCLSAGKVLLEISYWLVLWFLYLYFRA